MKLMLTGATGFVGKELVTQLLLRKNKVNAITRNNTKEFSSEIKQFTVADFGDLSSETSLKNIKESLQDVDVVIHADKRTPINRKVVVKLVLDKYLKRLFL